MNFLRKLVFETATWLEVMKKKIKKKINSKDAPPKEKSNFIDDYVCHLCVRKIVLNNLRGFIKKSFEFL